MKKMFWFLGIFAFAMIMLFTPNVFATNGYFSHGFGTQSKALAGAGVAFPLSTLVSATNPAGLVWLGKRYDVNIALFSPNRQYTITGNPSGQGFGLTPGTVESDSKYFPVPSLGANWMISPNSSIGLAFYGNGGMNTKYNTKTFDSPMATVTSPTGIDLSQMFLNASYSMKFAENQSFGVSVIFGYQRFKAEGLQAFAGLSSDPNNITNNGYDNASGFGARIGYLGRIWEPLAIGASYQTKIYMSKMDKYAGLFAEKGDFDIPANWTAGFSFQATPKWTIIGDVQQILYGGVNSLANPMDPNTLNPQMNPSGFIPLGNDNAAGFGWKDMTIFKFGIQWDGIENTPLRLGYSYGSEPIPDTEMMFNILAPAVIEQHITFGGSRKLASGQEINLSVMYVPAKTTSGPNTMEIPGQQEIELKMSQWEIELGFGF